ncbi:MAG: recombinase family protein [Hamadaea sp.]|nr:recombinase family protein [Hamadaea sp.]
MALRKYTGLIFDVYTRISRVGDDKNLSPEDQAAECVDRIEDAGGTIGEVFTDKGRSAWNPRVKRKAFATLMERLENRGPSGPHGLIVFDLARFSRQPIEGERLITAAESGLVVLDSEGEYDLTSASGKKAFRDQMNSAAYESDRTSTRTKRGKKRKAMRGESNHTVRPFGFEPDGLTAREPEWSELQRMGRDFLDGATIDGMIRDLAKRGVLTSYGRGWTRRSVFQVLTRPRNAGLAEYDGQIVGPLKGCEAVWDRDTYDEIVAVFAARRRGRPSSYQYLASGLYGCGLCENATLTGRPRINMAPYPDGEVKRQYWCQKRADGKGCGRLACDQRGLDKATEKIVLDILANPKHADAVEAAASAVAEKRQELMGKLEAAEQRALVLSERLGNEEMSLARYDAAIAPLDKKIAKLREQLEELPTQQAVTLTAEERARSRAQWQARWDAAEVPERRRMIRLALRGKRLVLMPADPKHPRKFDPRRIKIVD